MALCCNRLWVCEHHSATSSTNLLQICAWGFHPNRGIAEHSTLLHISVFLQWEKKRGTEWDGTNPSRQGECILDLHFNLDKMLVGPRAQRQRSFAQPDPCAVHRPGWGATEGTDVFRNGFSCITACTIYIYVQKWFPSPRNLYLHWKPSTSFTGPAIICCSLVGEMRNITPKRKCRQTGGLINHVLSHKWPGDTQYTLLKAQAILRGDTKKCSCALCATMSGRLEQMLCFFTCVGTDKLQVCVPMDQPPLLHLLFPEQEDSTHNRKRPNSQNELIGPVTGYAWALCWQKSLW